MNWKIEGLKRFDAVFGKLACAAARLFVKPRKDENLKSPKILVIRPGGIGDAVLLFPALRALKKFYPESIIDVLAEKRNSGIFSLSPDVDNIYLYDQNPPSTIKSLISANYEIVIDTEQWHRLTAFVSYITGAPVRAGFETNERALMFTHRALYAQSDYEAVSFLKLVSAVTGGEYEFKRDEPFIEINQKGTDEIEAKLLDFKKDKEALIGIFPGATVKERRWGVENFGALSALLTKEGQGVVLLGGGGDVETASEIKHICGSDGLIDFTGKTSLTETAYIISRLDLLVSGDSGLMHIAYGVGTRTVSLFGAGIEDKWSPQGASHTVINRRLGCSPCTKFGYTPSCAYGVKCLSDIEVDEVLLEVTKLLPDRQGRRKTP